MRVPGRAFSPVSAFFSSAAVLAIATSSGALSFLAFGDEWADVPTQIASPTPTAANEHIKVRRPVIFMGLP